MKPEDQDLLESIEHNLKINACLLKWLLAFKIMFLVALVCLFFYFPVILNKINVVVQCDEIKVTEKIFAFTIDSYTPNCTIDFEIEN